VPFDFRRQLQTTILAFVAFDMVGIVHGHHSVRFLFALFGRDRLGARETAWRVFFVETIDTVHFVLWIDRERHAVQTFAAHTAHEAWRVVRFAGRAQDPLHDRLLANAALFQRVEIVLLAVWLAINRIETTARQTHAARDAVETV